MTTPTFDAAATGSWSSSNSNSGAPLSILTANANEYLVVLVAASVNAASGGTALSVSSVTATGTGAPSSFTKLKGLSFYGGAASGDYPACLEAWGGQCGIAGGPTVTVTLNQSIDDACVQLIAVKGVVAVDAGTAASNTEAIATTTTPVITGISSSGGSLFVIFADTSGSATMSFGSAPTNITTNIAEQHTNAGAVNDNSLGSYYGTSAGALSSQTITSQDTASTSHGNANWGAIVVGLSSAASGDSAAITTTLGHMAQVLDAGVSDPAGLTTHLGQFAQVLHGTVTDAAAITTHLGQFAQVLRVVDEELAVITTHLGGHLAQLASVTPRIRDNPLSTSGWTISP